MTLCSRSPAETERIGYRLGTACCGGELIGLVGDLGAGKTCLVRGLAAGLGIDPERVRSPTFILMAEYPGRLPLFHIDLYRLTPEAIDEAWLREYLFSSGVAVVEWFDRLREPVSDEQLRITLTFGNGDERQLACAASGPTHAALLTALGSDGC
jgi:tRNA threonylcarbamoyladenosine biosynthesis protein TsaE